MWRAYVITIISFLTLGISPVIRQGRSISPYEKRQLTSFFEYVIMSDGIYTFLGEKPMTFLDLPKYPPSLLDFPNSSYSSFLLRIHEGFRIWNSWKNKPYSSQIFITKLDYSQNESCIVIIHKRAFLNCVKEHQAIFNKLYGQKITPKEVLERFTSKKYTLEEAYKNNDVLLGILLGYGAKNAQIYQRRKDIDPAWGGRVKTPSSEFKTIEDELTHLKNTYWNYRPGSDIPDLNPLFLLKSGGFIADRNSAETKQILKRYEKAYKKALHLYRGKDFLNVTLTLLED